MDLPPEHMRAIAKSGDIFLLPLVARYGVMYREAIDLSSTSFGGGIGAWMHQHRTVSHESEISARHRASLDSAVWLDLRGEPWVVTVPGGGESVSSRITDLWGHLSQDSEGSGAGPRPVLVASEGWVGAVPPGIGPIARAETAFVRCSASVQTRNLRDFERIRTMQRSLLARKVGEEASRPAVPTPPAPGWWPINNLTLTTMEFWPVASFTLGLVTPKQEDLDILTQFAGLGVEPGRRWVAEQLGISALEAIEAGMNDAIMALMRASGRYHQRPTARSRSDLDRDYFGRAVATLEDLASRSQS